MKRVIIVVLLIAGAALAGVIKRGQAFERGQEIREEFTRSYQLQPGAGVTIERVNGSVTVETYDGEVAELGVSCVGSTLDSPGTGVDIDANENSIAVRGNGVRRSFWRRIFGPRNRQDIRLKVPHNVSVFIRNVNGPVITSGADSRLDIKGVNGRVEINQSKAQLDIAGVNGRLKVEVASLHDSGLRISGVNGRVVLQVSPELNAELSGAGINGKVSSDIPGVNIDREKSRFSTLLGNGGPRITLSAINGRVRVTEAELFGAPAAASE